MCGMFRRRPVVQNEIVAGMMRDFFSIPRGFKFSGTLDDHQLVAVAREYGSHLVDPVAQRR